MTNVTRLESGPQNFTKKDNEIIILGRERPIDYVFMQPFEYCVINDPVMRDQKAKLLQFLRESNENTQHDRERRKELLQVYKKEAATAKLKGNIA